MAREKNIIYPEVRLKDVLAAFWRGMRPQKWLLLATVLTSVTASAIGIYVSVFYKKFFDIISVSGSSQQISKSLIGIIIPVSYTHLTLPTILRV